MAMKKRFARKRLTGTESLGERLRTVREQSKKTIEDLHHETGIRRRYLQAIEDSRYDALPGDVYARNFIQAYATALGINAKTALKYYEREHQVARHDQPVEQLFQEAARSRDFHVTPRLLRNVGVVIVLLGVFVYLGVTVQRALQPPTLTLTVPAENFETSESFIDVSGTTEPESTITINGKEILGLPDGTFTERIYLQDGVNIIRVGSERANGRENVIERRVLYRSVLDGTEQSPDASAAEQEGVSNDEEFIQP